jgi:hypothetical protein
MSRSAVIFVILTTIAVGQLSAQTTATTATGDLPVSLDKIRKALDDTPTPRDPNAPKFHVDASQLPVFRTRVDSNGVPLSSMLDDGTNVGAYVRPPNGLYDYEFKQMVTPDPVKGCGRLTSTECFQLYGGQLLSSLLWQRATDRKKQAEPSSSQP